MFKKSKSDCILFPSGEGEEEEYKKQRKRVDKQIKHETTQQQRATEPKNTTTTKLTTTTRKQIGYCVVYSQYSAKKTQSKNIKDKKYTKRTNSTKKKRGAAHKTKK